MFTTVLYHPQVRPALQREYSALLNGCWQQEEMDFLMEMFKACYLWDAAEMGRNEFSPVSLHLP